MRPPIVYDVTMPSSHRTSSTMTTVDSISTSPTMLARRSNLGCAVMNTCFRSGTVYARRMINGNGTRGFNAQSFLASAGLAKRIETFARDEIVFAQGDRCDNVLYIQQGGVKLSLLSKTGREAVVAMLGPGDFFGEGCLAGQPLRIGTATAITPSTILLVDKARMVRLLHKQHAMSDRFITHMLARNIRIEEDLVDQLFNSSEKRLARTLLVLARYGKNDAPVRTVTPISQKTLAEMVGTTRSRVNFFMKKFQRLGFIDYK